MRKVPWKESDDTNPLNFYGQTKLEGEKHILANDFDSLIIRTSGIYSNIKKKIF